jgi:hypothetical protein
MLDVPQHRGKGGKASPLDGVGTKLSPPTSRRGS